MKELSIEQIASFVKGELIRGGNYLKATGLSIDSRSINKGDMFIAIKGENFDGHSFVNLASENGASVCIVEKAFDNLATNQIVVNNTYDALRKLAISYKNLFKIPFIALTGSSGKTTTKDLIYSVLSGKYKVMRTKGNFNNQTGVPLTLLSLEEDDEIAIVEMGMSSKGEIENLVNMVNPDIALITNIGIAHMEYLGSRENIFKAKCEIFSNFKKDNLAIVNGDDDYLKTLKSTDFNVVKLGIDNGDFLAKNIKMGDFGVLFDVIFNKKEYQFKFHLPGIHNVYNALFAVYLGFYFSLTYEEIQEGLNNFKASKNRMEIIKLKNNSTIINDTYNSNPEAFKSAVNALKSMAGANRKMVVAGDMKELGDNSHKLHYESGEYLAKNNIDYVFTLGNESKNIILGAKNNGINEKNVKYFNNKEDLTLSILSIIDKDDYILFKASRSMKLDEVVREIERRCTK